MISPENFYNILKKSGFNFYTGVPDSLLKDFCAYVSDHTEKNEHVIVANEGNAIALAAGHFLGNKRPGFVYMQNSGIGNAINPLLSLADAEVYSIPMMLMIGWRGEPGINDEPQHIKHAIIVRKGTFEEYKSYIDANHNYPMTREQAICKIVDTLLDKDIVVSTTGMSSRELYECRVAKGTNPSNDFLTVGSMGHASSIALGLANTQLDRRVICIDGDGSLIMHMGSLAIIAKMAPSNLVHIVISFGRL